MLTVEENNQLTRVGSGTPMGELLRRYWQPIAAVSEMNDRWTKRVRLLGEDLVLFKDRSGQFGLIAEFCPHRNVSFAYGIPETEGIRCAYHGWKFNAAGRASISPTNPPAVRSKTRPRRLPTQCKNWEASCGHIWGPSPRRRFRATTASLRPERFAWSVRPW